MIFNKNIILLLTIFTFTLNNLYCTEKEEIQGSDIKKPRLSMAIKQDQSQTYAIPTYDATFKHLMSNPTVYKSFLRTFIPDENITLIETLDTHLRPFTDYQNARTFVNDEKSKAIIKRIQDVLNDATVKDERFDITFTDTSGEKLKDTYINGSSEFIKGLVKSYGDILKGYPLPKYNSQVDFLCKVDNKYYALVEVQVVPQDFWDKRALSYAANIYGRQLNEGQNWRDIKKVICVNLLGGGKNDLLWNEKTGFTRIAFKDDANKIMEDGIEILQYPLYYEALRDQSEISKRVSPESQNEYLEWIEFFEAAHYKKEADVANIKSNAVKSAYELIKTSTLPKDVEKEYHRQDEEFFQQYSHHIAYEKKTAKEEGKLEGKQEAKIDMARKMLGMNMSIDQIINLTGLTEEQIKELQFDQLEK